MPIKKKPVDETRGQIVDPVIKGIVDLYGFDDSWSLLPIIPMGKGFIVLNNKSETTKKAVLSYENKRYILKEVPWYCSNENFVSFMLKFQKAAHDAEMNLPGVVETQEETLFAEYSGKYYYLQEFILGESYNGSDKQIHEAGSNLGKLHEFSKLYVNRTDFDRTQFRETSFSLAKNMLNVLNQLVQQEEERLSTFELRILTSYITEATELVSELKSKVRDYPQLIIQVHGDYNPLNILYDDVGAVKTTFDLENTILDHPVHDIAEGLVDFSFNRYKKNSTRFKELSSKFNTKKVKTFIEGYKASNKLIFELARPHIPEVIGTTLTELITLGLVRGDYDFKVGSYALEVIRSNVSELKMVIEEV